MVTRIPGVPYAAAPRAGASAARLEQPVRLIVLHDTGNNSSDRFDEASYAATRTDAKSKWTSSHAYTDPGGVLGSLPLDRQAWAAFSYANGHGWHIEMCRTAAGVSLATRQQTAPLVRQLAELGGVPLVKLTPAEVAAGRRGICGHRDITIGLGVGNHEDPGAGFDWSGFMAMVKGGTPAAPLEEEEDVTKILVRGFAPDPNQVWLADGMTRRKLNHEWVYNDAGLVVGPCTNSQIFQPGYLGQLGNGGNVLVSGGDPNVWGIDVTPEPLFHASDEQLEQLGETLAEHLREGLVEDVADELHDRLQA